MRAQSASQAECRGFDTIARSNKIKHLRHSACYSSCCNLQQAFSLCFNDLQGLTASPCDMVQHKSMISSALFRAFAGNQAKASTGVICWRWIRPAHYDFPRDGNFNFGIVQGATGFICGGAVTMGFRACKEVKPPARTLGGATSLTALLINLPRAGSNRRGLRKLLPANPDRRSGRLPWPVAAYPDQLQTSRTASGPQHNHQR